MKATKIGATFAVLDNGTCWPLPSGGEHNANTAWALVHGTPTREQLLHAASILDAFSTLLQKPQRERNAVCSALRKALDERENGGGCQTKETQS